MSLRRLEVTAEHVTNIPQGYTFIQWIRGKRDREKGPHKLQQSSNFRVKGPSQRCYIDGTAPECLRARNPLPGQVDEHLPLMSRWCFPKCNGLFSTSN